MPQRQFSAFFLRLHGDKALRDRFAHAPAAVLKEEGFDPEMLNLPSKVDPIHLEKRLDQLFKEGGISLSGKPADVARLTPNELWERFSVIALKPEDNALSGGSDTAVVVAVVVYGVSMVTSGSGTQVTVVGKGIGSVRSLIELKQLRDMARRPAEELSFSVTGPDGVV